MAKKALPKTSKSRGDVEELEDWLKDEIESVRDDAAVAILELLKGEEGDRVQQAKNRIEECKAQVEELKKLLDWASETRLD